jgi:hypothetical protein
MKSAIFAICISLAMMGSANAGGLLDPNKKHCSQYSLKQLAGWRCAWITGRSQGMADKAETLERLAAQEDDPFAAAKLRARAEHKRREAIAFADEYRRKYQTK